MHVRSLGLSLSIAIFVAACGGGGGSGSPSDQISGGGSINTTGNIDTAARGANCPSATYGAAPPAHGALPAGATITVTDAMSKVRADMRTTVTPIAQIDAARNEYEMFQIVVRSDTPVRVSDIHFDLPTLPQAGLSEVDRVMIYRAGYMNITQTSNSEGVNGLWPDALIPKIDSYACETRNAFPYDVAAGRNQSFYVEVYVPLGTTPGRYTGTLSVSGSGAQGEFVQQQALDLNVWNFTIPSTSTLQNSFGFSGDQLWSGHRLAQDSKDIRRLTARYMLSGLRHRISMSGGFDTPLPYTYSNGAVTIDWSAYDAEVTPFMNGGAMHNGATLSTLQMSPFNPRIYQTGGAAGLTAYSKAWADHLRDKGWFDKFWAYTLDEPRSPQFAEVRDRARAMLAADPKMQPLVTQNIDSGLGDTPTTSPIRIWTPLINQMSRNTRAAFDPYLRAGAQLWWYQSCESHGCQGEDVTGYPSYMIDVGGASNRAMEWLSFSYQTSGELYFNTMESYFKVGDPWDTQYLFTGNGDGTLFYPGRPDRIGGTTHIPIESLRLKLIREGFEDYEYLHLLAASNADQAFLNRQVAIVAREPTDFAHDAPTFYRARSAIALRLGERMADGTLADRSDGR